MSDSKSEGWIVVLDLNAECLIEAFGRPTKDGNFIGFEDFLDMIINCLFVFSLQNARNEIALILCDANNWRCVFPTAPNDATMLAALQFPKLRNEIFARVWDFVDSARATLGPNSQIVSALFCALCRKLKRSE